MQHHKYSLTELENMVPWEREIYVDLLMLVHRTNCTSFPFSINGSIQATNLHVHSAGTYFSKDDIKLRQMA